MNPIRSSITGGVLAAAALFLSSEAQATGWCPTPSSNTISCNGCSRELTCEVNGFGINITGSSVTLDGKGHRINYSNGSGVYVTGFNVTIQNLQIYYPAQDGILFVGPRNGSASYLYNVTTTGAGVIGIENSSENLVTISYSSLLNSGSMGVLGYNGRTDVKNSSLWGSPMGWGGYWAAGASNSTIVNNSFNDNGIGAYVGIASNVIFSGDKFSNNSGRGLHAESARTLSLQKNWAAANGSWGCEATGGSVSGYGNTWGTSSGCP